jgi:glycosyltransferase involved in cell wall biosynthesis
MGVPFAVVSQANYDSAWVGDDEVERYQAALSAAQRYYFVSDANWRLAERQTGCRFANAEVVRNPFNVPCDAAPPWPSLDRESELHMACVARLHAPSKGQDMLLQVLAEPQWRSRKWTLSLYGEGPNKITLKSLVERLGLGDRVAFRGHVGNVVEIWAQNHILVMPSRAEGLPLAMVEAMMCGRPAVATDVAGNAEIVIPGETGFLAEAAAIPSIGAALERMWDSRANLEAMGKKAALTIRSKVPPDPVGDFANKLRAIISPSAAQPR